MSFIWLTEREHGALKAAARDPINDGDAGFLLNGETFRISPVELASLSTKKLILRSGPTWDEAYRITEKGRDWLDEFDASRAETADV